MTGVAMKRHSPLARILLWLAPLIIVCGCSTGQQAGYISSSYPLLATVDLKANYSPFEIPSLAWSPDGSLIAMGSNLGASLYSVQNGSIQRLREPAGIWPEFAWAADGSKLAGSDSKMWVWDSRTGQISFGPLEAGSYEDFGYVFWRQDGQSLISTFSQSNTNTSTIEQWDPAANTITALSIPGLPNTGVIDQSPDGQFLALSDTTGGPVQIWDSRSGQVVHALTGVGPGPFRWNPSGTLIAASAPNHDIVIWDTKTWQQVITLPSQGKTLYSVRWLPQGGYLAAGGDDGAIIWNLASVASWVVHGGVVLALEWDPKGKRLATTVNDKVYLWDVTQLP